MTIRSGLLAITVAMLAVMPAAARAQGTAGPAGFEKTKQVERAIERCKQNRGVDCTTPEGLKEWILSERSREEAVKEGSGHLRRPSPIPPKSPR